MADDPDRAIYQDLNTLSEPIRCGSCVCSRPRAGGGRCSGHPAPQSTVTTPQDPAHPGLVQRRSDGPANLFRLRAESLSAPPGACGRWSGTRRRRSTRRTPAACRASSRCGRGTAASSSGGMPGAGRRSAAICTARASPSRRCCPCCPPAWWWQTSAAARARPSPGSHPRCDRPSGSTGRRPCSRPPAAPPPGTTTSSSRRASSTRCSCRTGRSTRPCAASSSTTSRGSGRSSPRSPGA